MAEFQIKILADTVLERLRELPSRIAKNSLRKGMRRGMKVVEAEAKSLAPVRSGQTRKAVKVRAGKRRKGLVSLLCQVGEGDYRGNEYYASFVEYGHYVGRRKLGNTRTYVEPRHWMADAYKRAEPEARRVACEEILFEIDNEVKKLGGGA